MPTTYNNIIQYNTIQHNTIIQKGKNILHFANQHFPFFYFIFKTFFFCNQVEKLGSEDPRNSPRVNPCKMHAFRLLSLLLALAFHSRFLLLRDLIPWPGKAFSSFHHIFLCLSPGCEVEWICLPSGHPASGLAVGLSSQTGCKERVVRAFTWQRTARPCPEQSDVFQTRAPQSELICLFLLKMLRLCCFSLGKKKSLVLS